MWSRSGSSSRALSGYRGAVRRLVLSIALLAVIAVVPVVVYLLRSDGHGAELRATVGRCSATQHAQHRAACDFIDRRPTVELVGPFDETGTPFRTAFYSANGDRRIGVRLDGGRYNVLLRIDRRGTIATNVPADSLDMSTGDHDLGTITPRAPWTYEGVPGA
jgi:hypothetical protein